MRCAANAVARVRADEFDRDAMRRADMADKRVDIFYHDGKVLCRTAFVGVLDGSHAR